MPVSETLVRARTAAILVAAHRVAAMPVTRAGEGTLAAVTAAEALGVGALAAVTVVETLAAEAPAQGTQAAKVAEMLAAMPGARAAVTVVGKQTSA
jgi:hypothetical protein